MPVFRVDVTPTQWFIPFVMAISTACEGAFRCLLSVFCVLRENVGDRLLFGS